MRDFPIGLRLIATTIGALSLMVIFVGIAWFNLNSVTSSLDHLVSNNMRKMDITNTMRMNSQMLGESLHQAVLLEEPARSEERLKKAQTALTQYLEWEEKLRVMLGSERGHEIHTAIVTERKRVETAMQHLGTLLRQGQRSEARAFLINEAGPTMQQWRARMVDFLQLQHDNTVRDVKVTNEHKEQAVWVLVSLIVFAVLVMIPSGLWVTRQITQPLQRAVEVARAVADVRLDNRIDTSGKDETAALLVELEKMQTQLRTRIEEERRVATEALRIKTALDAGSNCVMVADTEGRIIYCNNAVLDMLRQAETDIRQHLPGFRVETVVGSSFDQYHRNPGQQRNLLAQLQGTYRTQIEIAHRHFSLAASPIFGDNRERLGTVVEWQDRTLEVEVENEVSGIISAAAGGDFSRRVETARMSGFFRQLGEDINRLLEASNRALDDVGRVLARLSQGDLTHKIETDYQGILGKLKDDTNATVDQLQSIIRAIQHATEAINTAAQEIASGNQDLSARTEEQASSLEQTASSMEELTSTVRQNAENARTANQLAAAAETVAERAGGVVGQVVETMSTIHQSSSRIADIIGVIDSIAFQTNILALNAAVEAARAGEQGRGFAVVASEVRNLAQRSAGAAKEIKALIADSVDKVQVGSRLVNTAGQTMEEVVRSIKDVAALMTDIASASREQSSGIEQVGIAVGQMDEMTQQNAALVEEAAAAAESLEEQARSLAETVAVFGLGESPRAAPSPRLAAPPPAAPSGAAARQSVPGQLDDEWQEF